jgi:ABC-type ATPase with predicted acetyltransferase domain
MIVLDMQPFSVVSDSGFKQLIKKLDSKYELPSKTTIKQRLLPELYNEIKEKLRKYLETVESVALTTDLWTSNYSTISYMTVTCHFLKEKKLVSTVLDTLQLAGTHNAENISTCLQVCVFKTC